MRAFLILLLSPFVIFLFNLSNNEDILFAKTSIGINVGQKAPTFKLSNINGNEFELESFRQDKAVLLVFGATWCPACRHEVPLIKEYYEEFKDDGLEVINIDIGESEKKVKSFVKKNQINYHVVLDSQADVARLYKVVGIPLNIVLDKNGIIQYKDNIPPGRDVIKNLFVN